MTVYIKFRDDRGAIGDSGDFPLEHLRSIFLGPASTIPQANFIAGVTSVARQFAEREFRAAEHSYNGIKKGFFYCPDPWSGEPTRPQSTHSTKSRGALPLEIVPLFYRYFDSYNREFWAVVYGLYGRICQLYIPSLDLCIYDISEEKAVLVCNSLMVVQKSLRGGRISGSTSLDDNSQRVAIVDMPTNYGHQLINDLSGIQRLIDLNLAHRVDEIWLSGVEFFGTVERIFPEVSSKVRRFEDRWKISSVLESTSVNAFKLGSNHFNTSLRQRILHECGSHIAFPKDDRLKVAVTVRSGGRQCLNLPEVIGEVFSRLIQDFPELCLIIDGWVFAEAQVDNATSISTVIKDQNIARIRNEMAIAEEIVQRVPSGAVIRNLVGRSMCESINGILDIDAYVAHVGTLQHKIGFFAESQGVVHGPAAQLRDPEGGAFQADVGAAPIYLSPDDVEDVPVILERGPGFFDYKIKNIDSVENGLRRALEGRAARN